MPSSLGYIPGPLVIPDTWMVRLNWTQPTGKRTSNVLHMVALGPTKPDATTPQTLYDAIVGDAAFTSYVATINEHVNFVSLDMKDLRTAGQVVRSSTAATNPGTSPSNPLPEEVALVVTLRSDLAGQAHRGRVYLSGFSIDSVTTTGLVQGATQAAAQNFVQLVSDAINAGDPQWFMAIAHRAHGSYVNPNTGNTVPAEAAGSDPVTQIIVLDQIFDSQRRRK